MRTGRPRRESPYPIHASDHRRGGPDPLPVRATLHIKVFADNPDDPAVTTGTNKFVFAVAEDMAGLILRRVEAFVSTASSSGRVQVQVKNLTQAVYLLTTAVQVDAGELSSKTAAIVGVAGSTVENEQSDLISIDVLEAGTGARGLGVILEFA